MQISGETKIHALLEEYPFLEDFLVHYNPRFEKLKSRALRATIGRVASLKLVASTAGIRVEDLLRDIAAELKGRTGKAVAVEPSAQAPADQRQERVEILKSIIRELHDGGSVDAAREKFAFAVKDVGGPEIAEMEQQLMREGMPVEEVQRLCDVHVGAFKEALDTHEAPSAPSGHPVHTYVQDNRRIAALAEEAAAALRKASSATGQAADAALRLLSRALEGLGGLDNHYTRKENQLFPLLEKHGVEGPSKVMWGLHDEVRAAFKKVRAAAAARDLALLRVQLPGLLHTVADMIYKEEKILIPMALETLSEDEWKAVRTGEDELGYAFAPPAAEWPPGEGPAGKSEAAPSGRIALDTGSLSSEQVNLLLKHLPVDVTFVDEQDEVRYYSQGKERIFPRSPGIIGRKVQNCHPPKSLHVVEKIVKAFREGRKDVAEFWIDLHGRLVHIRYFAVRDAAGAYRGTLEVSQDATGLRALSGERRLLDWKEA